MTRVGTTNDISSKDTNSVDSALINSLDHFENVDERKKGQNNKLFPEIPAFIHDVFDQCLVGKCGTPIA